jgi:hypothetical protein
MYTLLAAMTHIGGVEEIRVVFTAAEAYLQPIVGVTSAAPYSASDVATAKSNIASALTTIPSKDTVASLDSAAYALLLSNLRSTITSNLAYLKDPAIPVTPVSVPPTAAHEADLLIRAIPGLWKNAYTYASAPWKVEKLADNDIHPSPTPGDDSYTRSYATTWDVLNSTEKAQAIEDWEQGLMQHIVDLLTDVSALLTPVEYVESSLPYDAAKLAAVKTIVEGRISAGKTQTYEDLMNALNVTAVTEGFIEGFSPAYFTPTDTHTISLGSLTGGTAFSPNTHI